MPTHKGIKLSVISQWELQIHPEFSHPDSSQFTVRGLGPDPNHSLVFDQSPSSDGSDSKADRILGRPPTVAVYIPSMSGARFWIRYSIVEAAAVISPWYYFKLYMNGRLITSWGANSSTKPSGQVMRGLFDPSERWNYRDNGIVFKNNGTEVRPFFFTKDNINRSAAEDGGLIEIMVFRARGRRRRVPRPEEFRPQDKWGIVMPTGGLLDKPEDAKFYDWHLKDPKDKPFASFQFHYRSWDSLIQQQLVPAEYPRALLPASPSLLSLNSHSRDIQEPPLPGHQNTEIKIRVDEVEQGAAPRTSTDSESSNTPWITSVFDDSPDQDAKNRDKPAALFSLTRTTSSYPLRLTNQVPAPTSKFSEAAGDGLADSPQSSPARRWGEMRDRRLPEIPSSSTSLNKGQHSRNSSTLSNAVSITPSLRSYVERNTISPEPPVIGIAMILPVIASTFGLNPDAEKRELDMDPENNDRASKFTGEPYIDAPSKSSSVPPLSPLRTRLSSVLTISNITLHKPRSFSSTTQNLSPIMQSPALSSEPSQLLAEDNEDEDEANEAEEEPSPLDTNMTTLSLTESEWMCRTPSPVRNDPKRDMVAQFWSPGVEKQSFENSSDVCILRKKAGNVARRSSEEVDDGVLFGRGDCEVKNRSGNWI